MTIGHLFWALTFLCCGITVTVGGRTGRWGVAMFLCAVVATHFAMRVHRGWASANGALFLVDLGHFLALYILAFSSKRYWPIWSAGFQLLAVLTSVAILLDNGTPPRLYRALENLWSLPMLITMAVGAWIDARAQRPEPRERP